MRTRIALAQLAGAVAFTVTFVARVLLDVARELEQATAPRPMRVPDFVPTAWLEIES